jgi:F0F1-type ATP synthase assembly protein I
MFLQIALIVGPLIVGAVYIGKFLDGLWATRPWLSVVLFLVATFIALPITYRLGMRTIANVEKAEQAQKTKENQAQAANTGGLPATITLENGTSQKV